MQDQRVSGDDGDRNPDWPVSGRITGPDVFCHWRPCRYRKSGDLLGRGHTGDDLVDVVDLFVACFGQDVLTGGVLGLGRLGPLDDAVIEVVVGDDGGLAVDVADVPADHADVRTRIKVEPGRDVLWRRDGRDAEIASALSDLVAHGNAARLPRSIIIKN